MFDSCHKNVTLTVIVVFNAVLTTMKYIQHIKILGFNYNNADTSTLLIYLHLLFLQASLIDKTTF